jgi:alpha-N-acetylglucosamine transferase
MTRGCIIFAYDGEIDYGSQAVVAAKLVQRHLGVPVSIITDVDTYESIQTKFNQLPFDKIILTDIPNDKNKRILSNGTRSSNLISFVNGNRNHAWELTPYDRTLVIDSDFLVLSNVLNQYWDVDYDFLITHSCFWRDFITVALKDENRHNEAS